MEIKQDTIGDILTTEHELVLHGETKYDKFAIHAAEANSLLSSFLKSIDPDRFIFAIFLTQIKKHLLLAQFSALRLHQTQAGWNLRQALEAGSWAAYAIANTEKDKFYEVDENNYLKIPDRLKTAKNEWLEKEFIDGSNAIKRQIKNIGSTTAHANLIYAHNNFKFTGQNFESPFFDFEDDYRVKTDLWQTANVAYGLMDLFFGVNKKYGGLRFTDSFINKISNLKSENDKLKVEQMNNQRYKKHVKN
jgi:hypothetical protein